MKVKITHYESPLVLVGAFKAEQGFAQSFGDPGHAGADGSYTTIEGEF